jgi:putative copper resistance protein D
VSVGATSQVLASAVLAHGGAHDVPPALTPGRALTAWSFEPLPLLALVLVGGLYLLGVRRLRRRGVRWPVARSLSFLALGLGTILVATSSALGTYDTTLLSVHMVQHMLLSMVAPVFLALGAPVTLALRALPVGGRRRLTSVLHSRVASVLAFPAVAGVLFVATPFALYFSGWYEATLEHPWLHELTHLHFVLVGCLWFWPLLGLDPVPGRLPHPFRLLAVFVTLPFHAFMGVAIMGSDTLIARDWYAEMGRTWGPSLATDQQWAGGLLWASGDLVGLIVFTVLFVQWMQASEREAVREDRRLDRLEEQARVAAGRAARGPSGTSGPDR